MTSVLPNAGGYPPGDLRYVYLHWTGGDYATVYDAYHLCVGYDGKAPFVRLAHDLRANMRDVRGPAPGPYAAHTLGRNSFAAGVAVCGMRDANPHDFGAFALRADMLALLCASVAGLCRRYEIAVDPEHVLTHAEAAVRDGYFGCGAGERWDIARLAPAPEALAPAEAGRAGTELRARIRAA